MNRRRTGPVAALTSIAILASLSAREETASGAAPTMAECFAANESSIKLRYDHRLREARNVAGVCAASSCPAVVRAACQKRVTELTFAIPTIVFEAKDASGNDASLVTVTMDGQPFAERLDGVALDADPGRHVFSFVITGHPQVDKHVLLYEGEKGKRVQIQLVAAAIAPIPPRTAEASGLGTPKLIGLTVGSVGVAGIVVGSVAGILTFSAWSSAGTACGPGGTPHCAPGGEVNANGDKSTAQHDGTISTVAFIAGGALAATGLVVFLTGGHHAHEDSPTPAIALAPTVAPDQAGFVLRGAFW
jgi:hypothetical protein